MAPSSQLSPISTPRVVATPLPPLKPSHGGNMWPSTAPAAAAAAGIGPHSELKTSTGMRPFSASSTSVAAASVLLPVRSTLVAPILPEPTWRMSPRPAARVSSSPKGIEPSRKPTTAGHRYTSVQGSPVISGTQHATVGVVDERGGRRPDQLGRDLLAGRELDRSEIGLADRAAAVEEAALHLGVEGAADIRRHRDGHLPVTRGTVGEVVHRQRHQGG